MRKLKIIFIFSVIFFGSIFVLIPSNEKKIAIIIQDVLFYGNADPDYTYFNDTVLWSETLQKKGFEVQIYYAGIDSFRLSQIARKASRHSSELFIVLNVHGCYIEEEDSFYLVYYDTFCSSNYLISKIDRDKVSIVTSACGGGLFNLERARNYEFVSMVNDTNSQSIGIRNTTNYLYVTNPRLYTFGLIFQKSENLFLAYKKFHSLYNDSMYYTN